MAFASRVKHRSTCRCAIRWDVTYRSAAASAGAPRGDDDKHHKTMDKKLFVCKDSWCGAPNATFAGMHDPPSRPITVRDEHDDEAT